MVEVKFAEPVAFTPAAEVQKQSTSSTATTISSSTASADMFTGGPSVQHVENKIRAHIFALRIRLREIFEDFDKLRSGSMSVAQFRRCVSSALEKVVSPMTEQEYAVLIKNYDKGNGMIKWTAFVDSIDRVFGAKSLEQSPTKLTLAPHEVVKNGRPMSPNSLSVFSEVIARLRSYVKHHGSDVKSWFKDFDKYNNGYITQNQFRRGIPQNLLSDEEDEILMSQYMDTVTGTVNYFKINRDVNRKVRRQRPDEVHLSIKNEKQGQGPEFIPVGTEEVLYSIHTSTQPNPTNVEDTIKKFVYKDRIRLIEFFRDYDRHNCGLVTESQFRAGLRLSKAPVEEVEIKELIEKYSDKKGCVLYRQFCASIDSVFTTLDLESNPLAEVKLPAREFLVQGTNELPPADEARFKEVIARLKTKIAERRPLLAPYFKDFDRVHLGNMGKITRSHFSRLLSTTKLDVNENDLHLLFRKFEDAQNRINYMSFIREVDNLTYDTIKTSHKILQEERERKESEYIEANVVPARSFKQLLDCLRYHVSKNRIRVSEFFRDFDKLRSYSISKNEFVRGLNQIGESLTPEEFDIIANHYTDPKKNGCCKWINFENDIEKVFGENHLEARPTVLSKPAEVQSTPFLIDSQLTSDEEQFLAVTLKKIREHLKLRQSSIKPFFKDFDKLYTGYVTKSQFRQCLTYAQCHVNDQEYNVLSKKWGKYKSGDRVCYLLFLKELENDAEAAGLRVTSSQKEQNVLSQTSQSLALSQIRPLDATEIEMLINRIKTKVKTERIRVIDFMSDFDGLKHGKITKNEFRRGLNVLFVNLTETELNALESKYLDKMDQSMVDYVSFSDDIESVFTVKGLEKNPTKEPEAFTNYVYESGVQPTSRLIPRSEGAVLNRVLTRLIEKVKQRRLDVLSYLEDFDFVNEGTITINQFRSILRTIGLPVDDDELLALSKRFGTRIMHRINYRDFSMEITQGAFERQSIL